MPPKFCLRMSQTTEELSATLIRRVPHASLVRHPVDMQADGTSLMPNLSSFGKNDPGSPTCLTAGLRIQLFLAHGCPYNLSSPCFLPVAFLRTLSRSSNPKRCLSDHFSRVFRLFGRVRLSKMMQIPVFSHLTLRGVTNIIWITT
ncbi:uncharacterized protein BT62DRAFT_512561 [Guyanagaster necrorhizus]|uniref:Uncharacterized protein n=1 Tax=Guyanagaster necrorhizus TaxID=856835 RepID=A0A9P8AWA5_9AGAR|nr:uncharacterized protein BT62DRAFT_512561 [Guyanagaster necrorhizus MCA 3950]KAG7450439.1 hypothetical protein BT62DRAFT_512561 [Guyanagaster necrorhizus MCA 3950]